MPIGLMKPILAVSFIFVLGHSTQVRATDVSELDINGIRLGVSILQAGKQLDCPVKKRRVSPFHVSEQYYRHEISRVTCKDKSRARLQITSDHNAKVISIERYLSLGSDIRGPILDQFKADFSKRYGAPDKQANYSSPCTKAADGTVTRHRLPRVVSYMCWGSGCRVEKLPNNLCHKGAHMSLSTQYGQGLSIRLSSQGNRVHMILRDGRGMKKFADWREAIRKQTKKSLLKTKSERTLN